MSASQEMSGRNRECVCVYQRERVRDRLHVGVFEREREREREREGGRKGERPGTNLAAKDGEKYLKIIIPEADNKTTAEHKKDKLKAA